MNQSITITPLGAGFSIATDTQTTFARNATEAALAVVHVFGTKIGQQLDKIADCPFCRDGAQERHGYNWRSKRESA